MSADLTRLTFDKTKHYRAVQQQQGRVQLDSDWNEQIDLAGYRVETETVDTVGTCGAPLHADGFHLVASAADLSADEAARDGNLVPPAVPAGDLLLTAGRCYVHGRLAENDRIVLLSAQPELPTAAETIQVGETPTVPLPNDGVWIAYLDVWARLRSAIDDPQIREVALGGPDTATRLKNSWQVKLLPVPNGTTCVSAVTAWEALVDPKRGTLAASVASSASKPGPCIVDPGAGYRRLENQLYRVEVHVGGDTLGKTTFKWSRDNGSIVSRWVGKKALSDELELETVGRDKVLNIAPGHWVELTDDVHEELNLPGTLVLVTKVVGNVVTIDSAGATGPVELADFPRNPKVRRWDSAPAKAGKWMAPDGEKSLNTSDAFELEDGVVVRFGSGSFRTGDFWLIPARTALPYVEWPKTGGVPVQMAPHGVTHHYCRLAVVERVAGVFTIKDCRHLFPPLTELVSLDYVSGDAQEVTPDPTQPVTKLYPLPLPLAVGVSNGKWPVVGARVRFTVKVGGGTLVPATGIVTTDAQGIARCSWSVNGTTAVPQVDAELLDPANARVHLPVAFHARLTTAKAVSYDPAKCAAMKAASPPVVTVQDALDFLCQEKKAGVGCCATVGKHGEHTGDYPTVADALADLIGKQKHASVCVTLLPGDHLVSKDLVVKPLDDKTPTFVRLAGCGYGSRLLAHASVVFKGLAAVVVRDLSILVKGPGLDFDACKAVEVSGCLIDGRASDAELVSVRSATRVDVLRNEMRALAADAPDDQIGTILVGGGSGTGAAAKSVGTALVLADFGAAVRLVDNRIQGAVGLGGAASKNLLSQQELKALADHLRRATVKVQGKVGTLQLRGNVLTRISVSEAVVEALRGMIQAAKGTIETWACAQCADNVIEMGGNQVVARHVALTTTRFLDVAIDAGASIAHSASYVGNSAENDVRLFSATDGVPGVAANVILNVVVL